MKCPLDSTDLVMADRQGIEIDYCPQCRGVWLDRGEIDKLIERSLSQPGSHGAQAPAAATYQQPQQGHAYPQRRDYDDDDDYHHEQGHGQGHNQGHQKRKESWLSDFFD